MPYENKLSFLCDVLKKCRVKVTFAGPEDSFNNMFDETFSALFVNDTQDPPSLIDFFGEVKPYTIYKFTNAFKLSYTFLLLPQVSVRQIMIIGPYVSEPVGAEQVLEIAEKYGISPHRQKLLQDYYSRLPVVADNSRVFIMLETFGEHIWDGNNFTVVDVNREMLYPDWELAENRSNEEVESLMANMELMQKRYEFENDIIRAVSLGQEHKAIQIMQSFSKESFERRIADPIRNLKNYCIIMNTLLRKAVEKGGVHPLYINDVSSSFAVKIEQLSSTSALTELMASMFRSYCRLVRKHSMKDYSPTVKKVIVLINSDLSANLTLRSLAESQNISAGYLSSVFKKETGNTLTEYITRERMQLAVRLLTTTNLQIQTVALHCGIMDVQYFSKLFKKYVGVTPKEYRKSTK